MNARRPLAALTALGLAALAACHHAAAPMAAPAPAPVAAAPRPVDTLTTAQRARMHADSVRNQIQSQAEASRNGAAWGVAAGDSSTLADRIHFDFNNADLSASDLEKLEVKRQLLANHAALVVEISGNADERGPDEYNLALGLRRAAAAKRWLVAHGIADSRIHIISYGEEKPLDADHTDTAWSANRRDDFVVVK
ncbi:MAG TPA: OmpA family protein [Gemmatimonadales bacterium]|jgi:peptidoglycan-associated lipoprotein